MWVSACATLDCCFEFNLNESLMDNVSLSCFFFQCLDEWFFLVLWSLQWGINHGEITFQLLKKFEFSSQAGSIDVLHCYYAHGEENESFQRRSYWMLEE